MLRVAGVDAAGAAARNARLGEYFGCPERDRE